MKLLIRLLLLLVPRETQPAPTPEGNSNPGGSDPDGRPDWCPEKFWNPDVKQPRAEVMAKAYTDLEGKIRSKTEELKAEVIKEMQASAPEKYELKQPDIELPDGMELGLTEDDPLIKWFFGFAKAHGMKQEDVDGAIAEYIKNEMSTMPKLADEIAKLGDYGKDRILKVNNWLEQRLSADEISALSPVLGTAEAIQAMEKLMKTSGPGSFEGSPPGDQLTLGELRNMQNDPRYWREKDPVFIKKVQEGYQRLYNRK